MLSFVYSSASLLTPSFLALLLSTPSHLADSALQPHRWPPSQPCRELHMQCTPWEKSHMHPCIDHTQEVRYQSALLCSRPSRLAWNESRITVHIAQAVSDGSSAGQGVLNNRSYTGPGRLVLRPIRQPSKPCHIHHIGARRSVAPCSRALGHLCIHLSYHLHARSHKQTRNRQVSCLHTQYDTRCTHSRHRRLFVPHIGTTSWVGWTEGRRCVLCGDV